MTTTMATDGLPAEVKLQLSEPFDETMCNCPLDSAFLNGIAC